jgi:GNAT superfamily N-acetyltransferase
MMVSAENDPRRTGTIWALNLDEPIPNVTPLISAAFQRVGPEFLPALVEVIGSDASAEILRRFERGRRCYMVWVDGELAAYGWVSFDQEYIGELNLRLRLLPGEAYIWDCATVPAFRRQRLYSALLTYIITELRAENFCRLWIGADLENLPSQKGIARAGFKPIADMTVARVLAMRLVWVQGRPGVPENQIADARRVFLDNRDKVWLSALSSIEQS